MRHFRTGSNRICNTVAILATAGMLWMGSTQFVQAQSVANGERDSSHDETCSNAAVAGEWAYTETGTVFPSTGAVPFAAVAKYTLAADGDLSGSATSSSGGTVSNVTLHGIGTVNADCTGIVYVDNAREGQAIVTPLVLASGASVPAVLTADAKKLDHRLHRER